MEKEEEEDNSSPNWNLNSEVEMDINNQIPKQAEENQNEKNEKSKLNGKRTSWKELSLLQVLEQYHINQIKKQRGDVIAEVVRKFFLTTPGKKGGINPDCEEKRNEEDVHDDKNQLEWQQENPMSKALRNPIVIKMVIRHLNPSCILNCRLLNKLWLALCTEHLLKARDEDEDALRMRFRYYDECEPYIKNFDGILRGEVKTLESFNEFLSQLDQTARSSFPCVNFEFLDLVLNKPVIKQFFQLQGSNIRGLRLGFCDFDKDSVPSKSFTNLLMKEAPNVECLTILTIPPKWKRAIKKQGQILNINNNNNNNSRVQKLPIFTLPSLRCLRIHLADEDENEFEYYSSDEDEDEDESDLSDEYEDDSSDDEDEDEDENGPSNGLIRLNKEIVLSSPALKSVHVQIPPFEDMHKKWDFLTSISKSHLISHMSIRPEARHLKSLKKFAQSQPRPQLKHLSLSLYYVNDSSYSDNNARSISFEEFRPLALALLDSSKESLGSFSMKWSRCTTVELLKCDEIPPLKKVVVVNLDSLEQEEQGTIGSALPIQEFNRVFPNAQKLCLVGQYDFNHALGLASFDKETEMETAALNGSIPQVTSLILNEQFSRTFWTNLPSLFCNLVNLEVTNKNVLPLLPLIWNLNSLRLKWVKLEIPCRTRSGTIVDSKAQPSPALIFPGLDAAITGFPEEACIVLQALYPKILDEEKVQKIRTRPSILDLKYLEEFHVQFDLSLIDELPLNILSVVSGVYAFQRMRPKVQVHIQTKLAAHYQTRPNQLWYRQEQIEDVLEPLFPYADVNFILAQ